jgi:tetratricopeptide (TPR) repeat protein
MRFLPLIFLLLVACNQKEKEVKSNDFRSSISLLSEKILENPSDTSLLQSRANLFLSNGNLEGALLDMEFLYQLDSNNYQYLSNLSHVYYQLGEKGNLDFFRKALLILDREIVTLKNIPKDLSLRYKLYHMTSSYKKSLSDINNVLKIDKYIAEAYYYKGLNFFKLGDTTRAISQFQTTVEQDPDFVDAYILLGIIYQLKKDNISELYFNNALLVDSTSTTTLYSKGKYFQDNLRLEEAKSCYLAVLRFDPKYIDAYYNLGYISLYQKKYLDGANYFSEVIYFNPSFATAFFSRGLCFKALGEFKKANLDFRKTLEIDPDFEQARTEMIKI